MAARKVQSGRKDDRRKNTYSLMLSLRPPPAVIFDAAVDVWWITTVEVITTASEAEGARDEEVDVVEDEAVTFA